MKPNKMMNIASVLLILVLLTTCGLSKTYAKYITQSSSNDEARVAKWGVEVTVTGDNSFSKAYKEDGTGIFDDSDLPYAMILRNEEIVTSHSINAELLAPGTSGNLCTISLKGSPEVAVRIITTVDIKIEGWGIGKEEYFPIIFKINGTDYGIGKPGITNIATLKKALEDAINAVSGTNTYEPNTNLATEVDDLTINWRWNFFHDFVQAPGEDPGTAYYNNGKDTALADMLRFALNGDPNFKVPKISFDLSVQVVQID